MAFHWLTALAILALMVTGQMMDGLQDAARQIAILKWHVPMGLAVLLLTLARIAWWFFADRHPAPLGTGWQALAAKAGHTALYALLLVMTVSGVALMALSGAGRGRVLRQHCPAAPVQRLPAPHTPWSGRETADRAGRAACRSRDLAPTCEARRGHDPYPACARLTHSKPPLRKTPPQSGAAFFFGFRQKPARLA